MLTWPSHRVTKYLVKPYSGCIYEGVLDEVNICISSLGIAEFSLFQHGWLSSNQMKAWIEQKGWFSFKYQVPCFSRLWTQTKTTLLVLLSLQLSNWTYGALNDYFVMETWKRIGEGLERWEPYVCWGGANTWIIN